VASPNAAWVSDITYLWTAEGWMYLCVFIDLYSRRIVGWSLRERMGSELVTEALQMAIGRRQPEPGLIVHSDRGLQYASRRFRTLLSKHSMLGSMSRKGDCWDNAVAESFFGTLKQEHVPNHGFLSKLQARTSVFEYIEVFYNRERKHSTLGNLTPVEFEIAA
jgi:transposase InsO family protein